MDSQDLTASRHFEDSATQLLTDSVFEAQISFVPISSLYTCDVRRFLIMANDPWKKATKTPPR
jgi:hypothetical protein